MIYMDNAATSFMKPDCVYEAVLYAMKHPGNAGRGVNEASMQTARMIYQAREELARLFGIKDASRIAFTSNATDSLNIAIKGILSPGDHVITTVCEHNSVLRPLYEMEKNGVEIDFAECDAQGNLFYEEIEKRIRPNTKAIICAHGSNLTGNLVDIRRIGKLTHERNLLFIVDASQTAGVFPIHVEEDQIDILCFTGHKGLLGPQGTGGIFVREGLAVRPLKSGGSGIKTFEKEHPFEMPTALEAGTLNGPGIAGLAAAVQFIREVSVEKIQSREEELMWRFYDGIKDLPNLKVYGDFSGMKRCPIITINIGDYDSAEIGDILNQDYGIAVRTGAHCAPLLHERLGTRETGAVRFSLSYYNTEEEVDTAIAALKELTE